MLCLVMSDSSWPNGLWPARLLCLWNFSGKITMVGCHFLLQEIFLTKGSSPGLPHCRQIVYYLSYKGICIYKASKVALVVKDPPASTTDGRDAHLIPGWRRFPGEGNDYPLQYSCLENPTDREIWQATVHWVSKNGTRLMWLSMHSFINTTGDN